MICDKAYILPYILRLFCNGLATSVLYTGNIMRMHMLMHIKTSVLGNGDSFFDDCDIGNTI